MKKIYKEPKMDITEFDVEDVITTSTQIAGAGEDYDYGDGPSLDDL